MSDLKTMPTDTVNIGDGPSLDDKPLVPTSAPYGRPAGEAYNTAAVAVFRLKAQWKNEKGTLVEGYAYPIGQNAAESFWDYVVLSEGPAGGSALKFYLSPPDKDGWSRWNIQDDSWNSGYHLDCKATGWLYRASLYDTKFQIVNDQLFCSYWKGPAGSDYRSTFVSAGRYIGMGLPAFTCKLEAV
jgi:hypothetical protein